MSTMSAQNKVWTSPDKVHAQPYAGRHREYDEYIGEIRKERNAWRRAAFVSFVCVLLSIPGWVYLGSLPSLVPHVIEVAGWGEARYRGDVGENSYSNIQRSTISLHFYLRQFVRDTRGISTDLKIIRDRLQSAFAFVTAKVYQKLQADISAATPFTRALEERVEIDIESIIGITSTAYQIDWYEKTYNLSGRTLHERKFRGIYNVVLGEPNSEQQIYNPLGIFIDGYEIQEIQNE